MTILQEMQTLLNTKGNIRQAIIDKGVDIAENVPFNSYAEKISQISGGSGGGSDTFSAELLLSNVVNSGLLENEEQVVAETVSILENI